MKEALKLALEALKEVVAQTEGRFFCMKHDHVALQNARYAIARAREALAPIEIERELALQALHDENERLGLYEDAYGAQPEKTVCPFCTSEWVTAEQHDRNVDRVERLPLTNGEIYTAYITATNQTLRPQDERLALAFARAIEAAHGIKVEA